MKRAESILGSLERAGKWGEDALLVLILTTMILLAAAQIVLRNFFNFELRSFFEPDGKISLTLKICFCDCRIPLPNTATSLPIFVLSSN